MAKTKRENLMEKLSALQPHVPTSTRAKKTAKEKPVEKKKDAKADKAAPKAAARKKIDKPIAPKKSEEPPPQKIEAQAAPPPRKAADQEKPRESATPKPEKANLPFEGYMTFPFTMFEFWSGCLRSCYRMAETQMNFLINMSCWRRKF